MLTYLYRVCRKSARYKLPQWGRKHDNKCLGHQNTGTTQNSVSAYLLKLPVVWDYVVLGTKTGWQRFGLSIVEKMTVNEIPHTTCMAYSCMNKKGGKLLIYISGKDITKMISYAGFINQLLENHNLALTWLKKERR